jgi:hypothetical protein
LEGKRKRAFQHFNGLYRTVMRIFPACYYRQIRPILNRKGIFGLPPLLCATLSNSDVLGRLLLGTSDVDIEERC